jgi:protein SCO1/2
MIGKIKDKKWMIYVGFFLLLLIVFFLFIKDEHEFTDSKLAVINSVMPNFEFTNQNGEKISQKNTENKVYVAEYFFTSCKGICPKMNVNMRRIYEEFKNNSDFLILSHTCMPESDSVPVLKLYEKKMLGGNIYKNDDGSFKLVNNNTDTTKIIQNKTWYFLTGNKNDLYKMARQGYMIDNGKSDSTQRIEDQFIHTQFFALIDRYGRVRGIYDGLIEEEIKKLIADIPELMKEKIDHTRFLNGFSNSPN